MRQRHRVKVMTVIEGSIIVDFFLARTRLSSLILFGTLA